MQRIDHVRSRLPVWFLRLSLGSRPGRPVRGAAGSIRLRLSRTLQLTWVSTQKLRGYFAADPDRGVFWVCALSFVLGQSLFGLFW